MTEIQMNKTINTVKANEGYNICPKCGRQVYAILNENGAYSIGCLSCGMREGISVPVDEEMTDEFADRMRTVWNFRCLDEIYSDEAMEVLCISNGNYVLVHNLNGQIVHIARNMREVVDYIESIEYGLPLGIYLMLENTLEYLGCSSLVWEILNR